MDWLDLLAVQGTLKSLLQHHSYLSKYKNILSFVPLLMKIWNCFPFRTNNTDELPLGDDNTQEDVSLDTRPGVKFQVKCVWLYWTVPTGFLRWFYQSTLFPTVSKNFSSFMSLYTTFGVFRFCFVCLLILVDT